MPYLVKKSPLARKEGTSLMRRISWVSTFLRKNVLKVYHLGWLQPLSLYEMTIFLRWR